MMKRYVYKHPTLHELSTMHCKEVAKCCMSEVATYGSDTVKYEYNILMIMQATDPLLEYLHHNLQTFVSHLYPAVLKM